MRLHKLSSTILAAVVVLTASFALGGDGVHAPWPTDWNNWSDPALWATVGNPGNAQDTRYGHNDVLDPSGYGRVAYAYNIGKYEVTAGQYTTFLNAKAKTDTYGLYVVNMWSDVFGCKIRQSGTSGSYTYSVAADYANRPVNYVSFWDAARFTNWLSNGQGNGDTETGAYTLNGYNGNEGRTITRNSGAKFFVPTEDEWYKAAYHDKTAGLAATYFDYPTSNNLAPGQDMADASGNNANCYTSPYAMPIDSGKYTTVVGEFQNSDSPYGTFDQGGNMGEWNETIITSNPPTTAADRGIRSWSFSDFSSYLLASTRGSNAPSNESDTIGFRVASVPEPGSLVMLAGIALTALLYWWRKRA